MNAPERGTAAPLGWTPQSGHTGALLKLRSIVEEESGARFVIALFGDEAYRDRLIERLNTLVKRSLVLDVSRLSDFERLEEALIDACESASSVHVVGTRAWLADENRAVEMLRGLNYRREGLATRCGSAVVLWLDESGVRRLARDAPDFWAWRAGLLSFVGEETPPSIVTAGRPGRGRTDETDSLRRMEDIRSYLRRHEEGRSSHVLLLLELAEIASDLGLLDEAERSASEARQLAVRFEDRLHEAIAWGRIADVLEARGELDAALRVRREEQLPVFERLGEVRELAIVRGRIADVLQRRGELDEALRIRREEELPVYERLGDARSLAIAQGKIADVLELRGELDEALRIRREEELPVYERLGDARSLAIAQGRIADVLESRGELDEALRIRREEELPVYERLGDVRAIAITRDQIADVLTVRGELDEALRIRRDEVLPVFERLGDVYSRAVTISKIADVLEARGALDEALRIRREEQLPVFERLGDARSCAVTQGQIADLLEASGELDDALRIRREEVLPVFERLGDVRSRAVTLGKIADALQAGGELDEALRIRREEQLPVYERLGNVRSYAATRNKIADALEARGDLDEALRIRREEVLPVYDRLGDVRERAATLRKIAVGRLAKDGLTRETTRPIRDALAESFAIVKRLDDPVGVAHVGVDLARVLAETDRSDDALATLADAEAAFRRLGDEEGLTRVAELRRSMADRGGD